MKNILEEAREKVDNGFEGKELVVEAYNNQRTILLEAIRNVNRDPGAENVVEQLAHTDCIYRETYKDVVITIVDKPWK